MAWPILVFASSVVLFGSVWWYVQRTGDPRYNKDGIGTIVRLFQVLTLQKHAATKLPRTAYVEILQRYIDNFNQYTADIRGNSAFIKEEVYKRATGDNDFKWFEAMSTLMILIANGKRNVFHAYKLVWYLLRCGVYNHNDMIMKISLSATLCTLFCLPDQGDTLLDKAKHYKLIRHVGNNPFVGINACPMLNIWRTIVLPKVVNTDLDPKLDGQVIRYLAADNVERDNDSMLSFLKTSAAFVKANMFIAVVPFFLNLQVCFNTVLNAMCYTLGFETWNQYNSEQEDVMNGKDRPKVDKRVTISIWVLCVGMADWTVRFWLLLCPFVYVLIGNSSPIKEGLMCYGIFVHYSYLGLAFDPLSIVRHAVMGSVQDLRDVSGDARIGRITLPILLGSWYPYVYILVASVFWYCDSTMPWYSMIMYGVVTILMTISPKRSYQAWQLHYIMELFARSCCSFV